MNIYKSVYFRIESGYMCGPLSDRSDACLEELQNQLETAGWTIDVRRSPGVCPEVSNGKSHLYCHPTQVSGVLEVSLIKTVELLLKEGTTYVFRATDIYEDIHDFTWEELERYHMRKNRNTIEMLLLDGFRTKRSNLYKPVSAVLEDVSEKISVRTFLKGNSLCPSDTERDCVRTLFEGLLKEGHFVLARGKGGSAIARTSSQPVHEQIPSLF